MTFTVVGIFHGGTALEEGAVIMPLDQMQIDLQHAGKSYSVSCSAQAQLRPANRYDQYVKAREATD